MAIPIEASLVQQLIQQHWDSVDELALGWEERCRCGIQKTGAHKDRATIYRWLKQGLPNRRDEIFGLAAALDVDPFAIVNVDDGSFLRLFERERMLFLLNQHTASRLSALWPLLRPSRHWPDQLISHDFYARDWSIFDFDHPAEDIRNVYAHISIRPERDQSREMLSVFYIAYRRAGALDGLWRPYGIIRQRGGTAEVIAEMGYRREIALASSDQIDVETFFGPGGAHFRVASLHSFKAQVTAPSHCEQALRFPG